MNMEEKIDAIYDRLMENPEMAKSVSRCLVLQHGEVSSEPITYDSRRKSPRGERMMCQECGCDGNTEKAWMDLRHWLHELMLNTDGSAHFVVMDTLEKMRELEGE